MKYAAALCMQAKCIVNFLLKQEPSIKQVRNDVKGLKENNVNLISFSMCLKKGSPAVETEGL